ncbi:MAG: SUMF1/EgtB/PvdO family nonheme iron enzyme [Trichodesmium sp. ALOHA_ZT_67]|nr:SUMF1/EgtB/PvdO family nonheme iron enzyme [Trichodesmium sp. ALOHA_ZT_67]
MNETQQLPISIQPIINYPHSAEVGKTYLMEIDIKQTEDFEKWNYEEEEYPIYFRVDTYCQGDTTPLFKIKIIGEPAVVLHRFGGTYGPAKFLLTAAQKEMEGEIRVTLVNGWGVPLKRLRLENVAVVADKQDDSIIAGVKVRNNHAIAMGINQYNYLPSLRYAVKDAEVIKNWFEQKNFSKVDLFTEVISVRLKRFLAEKFEKPFLSAEDNFWFFFSGYGECIEDVDYLIPADSQKDDFRTTAISVNSLVEKLFSSGAGKVILFLDTNYISGEISFFSGFSFSVKDGQELIVFLSKEANEVEQLQQGSFTYALHEALRSSEGSLSINQLQKFLSDRGRELNKRNNQQRQILQKFISSKNLGEWVPFPSDFQVFQYTTPTVDGGGKFIKQDTKLTQYFRETIAQQLELEMVIIPGGNFTMGSPESEEGSYHDERPQHHVTVSPFFMGKYPVTQGQWRAIASQTNLKVNLDLDPEPSYFKEPYQDIDRWERPVEKVNWYQAVEFCERLSKLTGRNYRLPSEAEWEYACRAGTTTPFYFGETITSELVNYDGDYSYGNGPKGEYRNQTTPVGQFPPNAFGLYDMHGNVWEWCADNCSRDGYHYAPTDGSPWVASNKKYYTEIGALVRGGFWASYPSYCRSAFRNNYIRRVGRLSTSGFRVVCDGGITL